MFEIKNSLGFTVAAVARFVELNLTENYDIGTYNLQFLPFYVCLENQTFQNAFLYDKKRLYNFLYNFVVYSVFNDSFSKGGGVHFCRPCIFWVTSYLLFFKGRRDWRLNVISQKYVLNTFDWLRIIPLNPFKCGHTSEEKNHVVLLVNYYKVCDHFVKKYKQFTIESRPV